MRCLRVVFLLRLTARTRRIPNEPRLTRLSEDRAARCIPAKSQGSSISRSKQLLGT
jgi:hypothetical protein